MPSFKKMLYLKCFTKGVTIPLLFIFIPSELTKGGPENVWTTIKMRWSEDKFCLGLGGREMWSLEGVVDTELVPRGQVIPFALVLSAGWLLSTLTLRRIN